jgi:hypothetical protein
MRVESFGWSDYVANVIHLGRQDGQAVLSGFDEGEAERFGIDLPWNFAPASLVTSSMSKQVWRRFILTTLPGSHNPGNLRQYEAP